MTAVTAAVFLIYIVTLPARSQAEQLPSYIKPCHRDDPKLNECALNHARDAISSLVKGDGKYGIPVLDPLEVERISVKEKDGLGISFSCDKCQFYNLKNIQLRAVRFDVKKRHIEVEGSVPMLEVKGKYRAAGRVLVLPIQGQGDAHLILRDLDLHYKADYDLTKNGPDRKDFLKLKNPKLNFKAKKLNISLTNLFKGDKNLGDRMNLFLNQNWKEVLRVFGPAVANEVTKIVSTVVNGIADKVPYDEVLPLRAASTPGTSIN